MPLDLNIDKKNEQTIQASFDRIAHELINYSRLTLQGTLYTFTEIEFYFYDHTTHPDKYTHKHSYEIGKWRCHLQGLDISLGYNENHTYYGGILIRGLRSDEHYINGPKRTLMYIFEKLGDIEITNKEFGIVSLENEKVTNEKVTIHKSFRKGLSDPGNKFNQQAYRYYHSIENWNKLHVSPSEKKKIRESSVKL